MQVSHKQWHRNGAIPSEAGCETLSRPVPKGWAYCECAILSFMGQNIALPKIKNECQMDWDKVFPKKKI